MEKKKTSPFVYVIVIAIIVSLGVFIVQRLRQNAADKRAIDKVFREDR
jgi:hypothetical protein